MSTPPVHSCPLDCPDACTLDVTVEDGAVTRTNGNRINPLTDGFICGKVRRLKEHLYCPERIKTPLLREGPPGSGRFVPVSWDQALSRITREFDRVRKRWGGEAILPVSYGGSNGQLTQDTVDARLFRRLGASRCERTLCAAPSGAARRGMYGDMPGISLEDYEHSRLIVVWGCNPHATGIHLVPKIQKAIQNGARLVVVDPRRTKLAKQADLHLPLLPGTDLPLALAIGRWLFQEGAVDQAFLDQECIHVDRYRERVEPWSIERAAATCGVDADDLIRFGRMLTSIRPAAIRCGWGPERNRNGGSATASVLALPALLGLFGERGGGFTMSNSGSFRFDIDTIARATEPSTRSFNLAQLGDALLEARDPAIHALYVYNLNPVATLPGQVSVRRGLEREDLFTVVHDAIMTDTAHYADVVLPATTFAEHHELRAGYGAMVLTHSRPATEPFAGSRPNTAVFSSLCHSLGVAQEGDPETDEELIAAALATHPESARLTTELNERGAAEPAYSRAPILFRDVHPQTPSGKIDLCPDALDDEAPGRLYDYRELPSEPSYPLTLISPAVAQQISSTFGQLRSQPEPVRIHPEDANARGIVDGDPVRMFNPQGEVLCRAQVDPDVRPGVVSMAKGIWARHTDNGLSSNALIPQTVADLGGGACYNDARVEIEKRTATS